MPAWQADSNKVVSCCRLMATRARKLPRFAMASKRERLADTKANSESAKKALMTNNNARTRNSFMQAAGGRDDGASYHPSFGISGPCRSTGREDLARIRILIISTTKEKAMAK